MKLYIDTSDREKIVVGIDGKRFETNVQERRSQKILPFIIETISKNGFKLQDIAEIEAATGPGSFTGLRIGVSIANTLGWVLKVPINGKKMGQFADVIYE
jgi:tRNA threonylcarbamoyl adenosine modification protein YeaZ